MAAQQEPQRVTVRVPLPQKFDTGSASLETAWRKFKRAWDTYEEASRLNTQDNKYRAAVFKSCLSDAAQDVFEGLPFEQADDKDDITKIVPLFEQYCQGETCEVYETYKFHQRKQEKGETIDAYVSVLRQLASSCNFRDFAERMLRDQVVSGLSDDAVRQKLLQEKELTLRKCIELCRVQEASAAQARSMAGDAEVQQVSGGRRNKGPPSKKGKPKQNSYAGDRECMYCGKGHKQGKQHCPAYGQTCKKCSKKNHFARKCKQRDKHVHGISDEDECDDDDDTVLTVYDVDLEHVLQTQDDDGNLARSVHAKMLVGQNVSETFQLDSGATINSISVDTYKKVTGDTQLTDLSESTKRLLLYDKSTVRPVGERILPVRNPKNIKGIQGHPCF